MAKTTSITDKAHSAMFGLGWRNPFFLPALPYVSFEEAPVGTACVDASGRIRLDPDFIKRITDDQFTGVLAHEISHLLLLHRGRMGMRQHERWNRACDRAINQALREANIELPPDCLYPAQGQENWSAEQFYEVEPEDEESGGGKGGKGGGGLPDPNARPRVGSGCGVDEAPEGDESVPEADKPNYDRQWRELAAQAQITARERGDGAGNALARLLDIPPAKVRWESIVRNAVSHAVAAHGRDDVTWTKRSRRSPVEGPQMPGWTAYKAQVAVVIDTSGSMSDTDITDAVSNTVAIARAAAVKLFLVVHDHIVQWKGWISAATGPKLAPKMKGRGGTDFSEAYKAVGEAGRFDALIHLTDGECTWPEKPASAKRLVVALLGSKNRGGCPATATIIDASL